jgi:sugar lactone lactonase YvrE
MANLATLADLLAGCTTRVNADACNNLFTAATAPNGKVATDTLAAAQSIARNSWYQPEKLFALLDQFYPVPNGKNLRPVPYMPYLNWAPSAWVLPLKFDGGGYRAGGKAMFDSEGNLWVGDNFTVGWQGQDSLWQGHATKFAPNGRPISPNITGFTGGGMEGGTFGAAVDAKDDAWFTTYGSKAIAVFDKNGKPLTPPEGITFDGKLGLMQGVIVTPSGDVWVLGVEKRQLVYFPKGDLTKGRIVCEGDSAEPCKSFLAPFHLAIDQQDRIWVSNGNDKVTRFLAADPSKVETFKTGINNSGLNIDSQGNVWVTNRFGTGLLGMAHLVDMAVRLKLDGGEDYTALAKTFPTPPASAGIVWFDDWGQLSEEAFLRDFAGDVPADKARVLYAVQQPFKRTLLAGKTINAAWRSKPSWYAVSTEDRTINPDLERFMAKRMGAKTI